MTLRTAACFGADAAVAYYGGGTGRYIAEGRRLTLPLLMHPAEKDEYISKDSPHGIRECLAGLPQVEIHRYPGCSHAFTRHPGQHYDAAAAELADGRTLHVFQQYPR